MFLDVLESYGDALDEYAYFMDRDHVRGAVPVADVRKCPEIRNPGFADISGHANSRFRVCWGNRSCTSFSIPIKELLSRRA